MSIKETPASRREGKKIGKALKALLDEARAAGCVNPSLWFESESGAVFVLDRDHQAYDGKQRHFESLAPACVLRAPITTTFDTGAW